MDCNLKPVQKIYFISDFIMLIISGIIIIFEIILYISTLNYKNNGLIKDILSNWEFQPIFDLKVIDEKPSDEYTNDINQYSLMQWDGTIEGCNCLNATEKEVGKDYYNKINRFPCKYNNNFEKYCEKILPTNGRNINIWKGKKIIPIFNYNSKRYFDYLLKSNSCNSSEYKSCGLLDNKKNQMCILKSEKCPINKIIIDKKTPKDYNYTKFELNNGYYLFYTNEAIDSKILVSFKISEGKICVDTNKHYIRNPDYNLYSSFDNGGCDDFDERYFQIDSQNKKDLFNENGILNLTLNLPNFTLSNDEMFLFYRNYIGLSQGKNIIFNDIIYIKKFMEIYSILKTPKLIIILLITGFSVFEIIKNCYKTYSKYLLTNTDIIIKFLLIILNIIFLIMSLILIITEGNSITILNNLDQTSYRGTTTLKLEMIFCKTFFILSIILSSINIALCIFWFCGRNLLYLFTDESNREYENFDNRSSIPSRIMGKSGRTTFKSLNERSTLVNYKNRKTEHIKEEENEGEILDNSNNEIDGN